MFCFEVTETWDLLHFSELKKMIKEKYEQTNKETNKIIKKGNQEVSKMWWHQSFNLSVICKLKQCNRLAWKYNGLQL